MKNLNKSFMAVKVGKESVEGSFKMYKGMAAFNIVAVNPTKAELEALTGRELENEPEYAGKTDEGKEQVRVVFYGKTAPDAKLNNGIEMLIPISFMLTKDYRVGQTSGKYQIIDKFGRTAWATKEEVQSKAIPQYTSGPANISADYRLAWQGEEFLIDFLIQWLNIPGPAVYKDKVWVMKENTDDSEVSLDMAALFKGDVKELKELVTLAAAYTVKGAVGIRTVDNENGTRQYQAVFTRKFAKNAVTDYSKIDAAITEFQNAGGAPGTEFSTQPLHENIVEATTFTPAAENDPLGAATAPASTPWG
jgi:hypothetical protein|nr:MAG TPA: hypothetical protein [Crassvirales sp.]